MSTKLYKESRYEKECKALRKRAKRRARLLTFTLISVIAASLIFGYALVLKPTRQYESAAKNMEAGAWQEACKGFTALGSFKDSKRQAAFANCMDLFEKGRLNEASEVYLALNSSDQVKAQQRLGGFAALSERAMNEGRYDDAYVYYSLDLDNPERDDAMYAITVYLDCSKLVENHAYAEARGEISAALEVSHVLSAPLQTLLDQSYESEFNYYDSFTTTDLAFAVGGMETLKDEYEPAHIYLRDLRSAYYGGVLSMKEGKYADAIRQFEDIAAYADSAQKIDECRILLANKQAEDGDMQAALDTVQQVDNWQDYLALLPEDNSLSGFLSVSVPGEEETDEHA